MNKMKIHIPLPKAVYTELLSYRYDHEKQIDGLIEYLLTINTRGQYDARIVLLRYTDVSITLNEELVDVTCMASGGEKEYITSHFAEILYNE